MAFGGANYSQTVRTAAILTNAYVFGTPVITQNSNFVSFCVDFTIGSLTSLKCKIVYSDDTSTTANWFAATIPNGTSVTATSEYQQDCGEDVRVFKATGKYIVSPRPGEMVKAKFATLAVTGVGTTASSTCMVYAHVGVV